METESKRPKGREGTISALNTTIETLNLVEKFQRDGRRLEARPRKDPLGLRCPFCRLSGVRC